MQLRIMRVPRAFPLSLPLPLSFSLRGEYRVINKDVPASLKPRSTPRDANARGHASSVTLSHPARKSPRPLAAASPMPRGH